MIIRILCAAGAAAFLAACASTAVDEVFEPVEAPAPPAAEAPQIEDVSTVIQAAVASDARPEEDRALDEARKPVQTLVFAGVRPGMTVLEMEAGSGYFTELLSRTAGPDGKVIMQNPELFDTFIGDAYDKRLGGDRLPNVELTKTEFYNLAAEDGSIDLVTWVQGPHELWFVPAEGVSFGDPDVVFAEIARVLKPGGAFLAVDHIAPDDTGPETGGDTHRIARKHVDALAIAAGLKVEKSSDILKRLEDDLTLSVFDESVRGKTSQFVVLYRKPAE